MALNQDHCRSSGEAVWVLGGGQFGRHAVDQLKKADPATTIVVVERLPVHTFPAGIEIVCADGVEWLAEHLTPDAGVDKIIPALPVNLAANWLVQKLSSNNRIVRSIEIPDTCLHHFPHPIRLSPSRVVMSHADFLCPPNCSEPDGMCTFTQKKRPQALYRILEAISFGNFVSLTIRSHQFAPGVGGYFPTSLWSLLERAKLLPNTPLMVGTACKCHAIVDGVYHEEDIPDHPEKR